MGTHQLTLKPTSTLREAIVLFADSRVHHLWIVDGDKKPVGALTLTDLMVLLLKKK